MLAADAVPGQLLLSFDPEASQAAREQAVADNNATIVREYAAVGVALVEYDANSISAETQIAALQAEDEITLVEPNYYINSTRTPNDPLYPQLYGLNNVGQDPPGGTFGADIDAPEAWDISIGDSNTVVAVLDTGVDYNHPDLAANMWRNPGEIPANNLDDDGNGYIDDVFGIDTVDGDSDPMDDDGHGTHVAGTIAAVGDNDTGITGVVWDAKIMALRMISTIDAAVEAITYMIVMRNTYGINITVSNNSWGTYAYSALLETVVEQSVQAGIPFVASAGNDAFDTDAIPHYPSGFASDGVISVAATDKDDNLGGPPDWQAGSNYGLTSVDLGAPGTDIWSTYPIALDTTDGTQDGYQLSTGTSMASPHVSGAVALLRSINPSLTVDQVKTILMGSVDVVPDLIGQVVSGGRLDLGRAIQLLPSGEVHGEIWEDVNENGVRENRELPLPGWEVFLDLNNNGLQDLGEQSAMTQADGSYVLKHYVGPGTFSVRQVVEPGFRQTFPTGGVPQSVTFSAYDDIIQDVNFGNSQVLGTISGTKWIDSDLDGNFDVDTEVGGGGFMIYIDLNNNSRADLNEPSVLTNSDGSWEMPLQGAGTYVIREATPPGYTQTFPRGDGSHTITVGTAESFGNLNFGNSGQLHDFGDAPDSYGTTLASNGPRHGMLVGFGLGSELDGEADSSLTPASDNDGVSFAGRMVAGGTSELTVTVMTSGLTPAYVHAWVDFNRDGEFDSSEKIISNDRRGDGTHTIPFSVPNTALTGATWARVRYGWEYNLGPHGESLAGEVEDYALDVFGDVPLANDDLFDGTASVAQDSSNNVLDVLGNDFSSSAGSLLIDSVQSPTDQTGTVTVSGDGLSLLYTPRPSFFGVDTFTYTIRDSQGRTDSANVTVVVTPAVSGPLALDDVHYFTDFPLNASTDINVLLNDFNGPSGPIRINRIVGAPAQFGVATISNNGTVDPSDDVITYTPRDTSVEGRTDVFQYEIVDSTGNTATASVIVQIGDTDNDDVMRISLTAHDLVSGAPITSIEAGQEFQLRAWVQDLRADIPSSDPDVDLNGIFSAYFDVSLSKPDPSSNVYTGTFLGQPTSTANYPEAFNGDTLTPGLVNEAGAVQPVQIDGKVQSHGNDGPVHIWSQVVRADIPGNMIFQPDPGDDVDLLTLLFDPPREVLVHEIAYETLILLVSPGSGEGEGYHNALNPADVNGDGRITAQDPLLLINKFLHEQLAEGEDATTLHWDVNNDEQFNVVDIFGAINGLRTAHAQRDGASAEGESAILPPLVYDPLNTGLSQSVIADASTSTLAPLPEANRDEEIVPRQNDDGQVLRDADSESANWLVARSTQSTSSVHDPNWLSELDATLENEDLLEAISSDWDNDE